MKCLLCQPSLWQRALCCFGLAFVITVEAAAARPHNKHRAAATRTQTSGAATTSATVTPEAALSISRLPDKISPMAQRAYVALNRGDFALAQRLYTDILQQQPLHPDALNGLATIAAARGNWVAATEFYQRCANAHPANAFAQAGLIELRGIDDAAASERRLQQLLAEQPTQQTQWPLYFAYGNIQARLGHWQAAEQAYFAAHRLDSTNPDILFNLAVSLEHLKQTHLAVQYYERALKAGQGKITGFDIVETTARIQELRSLSQPHNLESP